MTRRSDEQLWKGAVGVLAVVLVVGWMFYQSRVNTLARDLDESMAAQEYVITQMGSAVAKVDALAVQLEAAKAESRQAVSDAVSEGYRKARQGAVAGAIDMCLAWVGFTDRTFEEPIPALPRLVVVDRQGEVVAEGRCKAVARPVVTQFESGLVPHLPDITALEVRLAD